MLISNEVRFTKRLFLCLGTDEKLSLIAASNLNDTEKQIMVDRFVKGHLAKEVSDRLNLSIDGFDRVQKKIFVKFYFWLSHRASFQDYVDLVEELEAVHFL